MTRKDFEIIAAAIKEQRWGRLSAAEETLLDNTALALSVTLHATNKTFNAARFLTAGGVRS